MRGQISSVHMLRGVAAMLVVWAHLSAYWLFTIGGTSWIQDTWRGVIAEPLHIYQDGGFLGVVLFFLISGYIVTHASLSENRTSYLTKRVLRIFPPLAFALAVLWTLMHVMPSLGIPLPVFQGARADRWLQSLLLLDFFTTGPRVLSVTWTLAVELIFYAMVFAVIGQQRSRPLASTTGMVTVWVIACWFITGSALEGRVTPEAEGVVVLVGVLLVGRCIYLVHSGLANPRAAAALGVVASLLVGVFQERYSPGFLLERAGTAGEPVISFVLALVLFVGMLWWAPSRAVQPFAWLGDISYSLYLLHLPVGFAALGVLHRLDVPNSLATLLATGAALLAATAAFHLVEKPSQRLARRLLTRRAKVTA